MKKFSVIAALLGCSVSFAASAEWVADYQSPGNGYGGGQLIRSDLAGNVYVAGYLHGAQSGKDLLLLKYDGAGSLLWAKTYDSPFHGHDLVQDMQVDDSSGKITLTGTSESQAGESDIFTLQYAADGELDWVSLYSQPYIPTDADSLKGFHLPSSDLARALVLDGNGGAWVAGSTAATGVLRRALLLHYDSTGALVSHERIESDAAAGEDVTDLLRDPSDGSLYWIGFSKVFQSYLPKVVGKVARHDARGRLQWARTFEGGWYGLYEVNLPKEAAIEPDRSLVIASSVYRTGPATQGRVLLTRFSPDGAQTMTSFFSPYAIDPASPARVAGMKLGKDGSLYVAGYYTSLSRCGRYEEDIYAARFKSNGKLLWDRYSPCNARNERATDMGIDEDDHVYVLGDGSHHAELIVMKFHSEKGIPQWTKTFYGLHPTGYVGATELSIGPNRTVRHTGFASDGIRDVPITLQYSAE